MKLDLRKPNAIEIKYGMSCGSCELGKDCALARRMEAEELPNLICHAYRNASKGEYGNDREACSTTR